jgi:NitT/TauT family transport system substrate-binding protein
MPQMLRRADVLSLLVLFGALCACATPAANDAAVKAPPTRAKSGELRVAFPGIPDFGDVPSLMAFELLRQEGYTVVPTFYSSTDLAVAALAQKNADLGIGSTRTNWVAIGKGAKIKTIMGGAINGWAILAIPEVKTCADLANRTVAVSGETSFSKLLTDIYLRDYCPGTVPQFLTIGGSENRRAALLIGRIEASPVDLADYITIQTQAPGQFITLMKFSESYPKLKTSGVQVNLEFAGTHPEAIQDYTRAILTAHRAIQQNPQLLQDAAVKELNLGPDQTAAIAKAYLDLDAWDVNGGMTIESVQYTLDFYARLGDLPAGLDATSVADLSYLNSVLNKIGRK